jgi:hypothetical protein
VLCDHVWIECYSAITCALAVTWCTVSGSQKSRAIVGGIYRWWEGVLPPAIAGPFWTWLDSLLGPVACVSLFALSSVCYVGGCAGLYMTYQVIQTRSVNKKRRTHWCVVGGRNWNRNVDELVDGTAFVSCVARFMLVRRINSFRTIKMRVCRLVTWFRNCSLEILVLLKDSYFPKNLK